MNERIENYSRDKHKKQTKSQSNLNANERKANEPPSRLTTKQSKTRKMSSMSSSATYIPPVATMAIIFKEYIEKMPDTLNTKKEIDEYIKIGLKEIMEERKAKKEKEKDDEPKKRPTKKAKKDDAKADADGDADAKAEEKAKKAAEKEAENAKKAEEKKKEKDSGDEEMEDEPKKPKKTKKEKTEVDEEMKEAKEVDEEMKEAKERKKRSPDVRKVFYDEMRPQLKTQFPDLNSKETTKKLAELWKERYTEIRRNVLVDSSSSS